MARPTLVISAPEALFESFFTPEHRRRLSQKFAWGTFASRSINSAKKSLVSAHALITTWDSPPFGDDLLQTAPELRIIAHCGGEVKSRFGKALFDQLTITTAPEPMARATAELGAALVLYCGRNVDFYRSQLQKPSNRIYAEVHRNGTPEFVISGEIGMIGFGRIGRTLVDLLRAFNLRWRVYDPYADESLSKTYPVEFSSLQSVLKRSSVLVVAAALTEKTRGILDGKRLSQLPDGATVINIARGGLVDINALTREVRRNRLRCAIDVTDPLEPLPERHPLRRLPGAILTPHIGGGSLKARHEMANDLIDDLERFFRGASVKNRIMAEMLARMT
jgi:Phosphoglycerate dehydrogenase and related dehydrogenases